MRFQASRAACIGKFNKDLSPVFTTSPAFYQSSFFEAINGANHSRRVNIQLTNNAADGAGFSGNLDFDNQAQNYKLSCSKPRLVCMLEDYTQHFAQDGACSMK